MKIIDKIKAFSKLMRTAEGLSDADRIQQESIAAVTKGINSPEWEKYMSNFPSNAAQLQRLIGHDTKFINGTTDGLKILAYVVSSGNCGGATTLDGMNDLPDPLKDELDNGLDQTTDPAFNNEMHRTLKTFA